jgi:pimeloyl-ACP methyl ester carboxylesterase
MRIDVNGRRLWFDVEGPSLVPDGTAMRARPTIVLIHGGPASYDHSYFKPSFSRLAVAAQVVYLDLRDHGRSDRGDPADWTFEACADDVRAFCDALGIVRPIVYGHSMGGNVVLLYGARHPGHAGGLVAHGTFARFDLGRLADAFGALAGGDVAELARRDFGGDPVTDAEWARVFAAFGPNVPDADALARRQPNRDLGKHGMELLRRFDVVAHLAEITSPVLVCVGSLDPIAPPDATREIVDGLRPGLARVETLEGAGHFSWLDTPDRFWDVLRMFIASVSPEPA